MPVSPLPILYGYPHSSQACKVRMLLVLVDIDHDYRVIDAAMPVTQWPADIQAAGRPGGLPVLCMAGQALSQSNAILQYLAARSGRYAGSGEEAAQAVREWLCWEAGHIGVSVPALRHCLQWDPQPDDVLDYLRARATDDLCTLNAALDSRDWLVGEAPSIADISCCACLYWSAQAGLEIARWPALKRWLTRIARLPGWRHPDQLQ